MGFKQCACVLTRGVWCVHCYQRRTVWGTSSSVAVDWTTCVVCVVAGCKESLQWLHSVTGKPLVVLYPNEPPEEFIARYTLEKGILECVMCVFLRWAQVLFSCSGHKNISPKVRTLSSRFKRITSISQPWIGPELSKPAVESPYLGASMGSVCPVNVNRKSSSSLSTDRLTHAQGLDTLLHKSTPRE